MSSKELMKVEGSEAQITNEVIEALAKLSEEELANNFGEQLEVEGHAYLKQALIVGVALREERSKDRIGELSELFDVHPSQVYKLGQVYSQIILPRLLKNDGTAFFPITGKTFYTYAVELAPKVSKAKGKEVTALDLLEKLEDKKAANKTYSTKQFLVDNTPKESDSHPDSPRRQLNQMGAVLKSINELDEGQFATWAKEVDLTKEDWPFFVRSFLRVAKILEKQLPAMAERMKADRKALAEKKAAAEAAKKAQKKAAPKPKAKAKPKGKAKLHSVKGKKAEPKGELAFPKPTRSKKGSSRKKGVTAASIESGEDEGGEELI